MDKEYKRSNNAMAAPLDDTILLLSIESGRYHSLDPIATRIWTLLAERHTLPQLVAQLVLEFDVTEADCERDVSRFLASLDDRKLLDVA